MPNHKEMLDRFYPPEIIVTSEADGPKPFLLAFANAKDVARANDMLPTRGWVYKRDRLVEVDSNVVIVELGEVPSE